MALTSLCLHITLLQRRLEQYFKNVTCFCKFDAYTIAQTAQITTYAYPVFTEALEMTYPVLKEVGSL